MMRGSLRGCPIVKKRRYMCLNPIVCNIIYIYIYQDAMQRGREESGIHPLGCNEGDSAC